MSAAKRYSGRGWRGGRSLATSTQPETAAQRRARLAPAISRSTLIREDAGAFWFRCLMTDGRTLTMSVPK